MTTVTPCRSPVHRDYRAMNAITSGVTPPANEPPVPFDPNQGEPKGGFPTYPNVYDIETYSRFFGGLGVAEPSQFERWIADMGSEIQKSQSVQKATSLPPEMQSFTRFSLLPEVHNGGVQMWPGIPPEALRKVVRENLIPQVIIGLRVSDVLRYARL